MRPITRPLVFFTIFVLSSLAFLTDAAPASAQVTFSSNEALFHADNPGLRTQTFVSADVAPGGIIGCDTPIDNSSGGGCLPPGDVLPGIAFSVEPGFGTLIAGPFLFFNLNPVNVLMPDGSAQKNVVLFPGSTVFAAGLRIGCLFDFGVGQPCVDQALRIEVFGPGDQLIGATDVITDSLFQTFVGIESDIPIERITLIDADLAPPSFNGIASVSFQAGGFSIPTLSEWGLAALAAAVGAAAAITLRRRRASAKI